MTALTKERNTPQVDGFLRSLPVKGGAKILQGALVVLAAGLATKGATALNLVAVGRAEETVDNTGGGDGAVNIKVRSGTFRYENSAAGDAIIASEIGAAAYIVDDQTVAKTNGTNTRSKAGIIQNVDANGVWMTVGTHAE